MRTEFPCDELTHGLVCTFPQITSESRPFESVPISNQIALVLANVIGAGFASPEIARTTHFIIGHVRCQVFLVCLQSDADVEPNGFLCETQLNYAEGFDDGDMDQV